MKLHIKRISIFLFIYACAFFVFRLNTFAQTTPQQQQPTPQVVDAKPVTSTAAAPVSAASTTAPTTAPKPAPQRFKKVFAIFETSLGTFKAKLFHAYTPITVENFIGLAEGKKDWQDPKTLEWYKNKPLYHNVIFHRVIKGFMIQTGDPTGTGRGGPGYTFADEAHPDLKHTKEGLLSMANAGRGQDGRGTNGSQFFITLAAKPHLDKLKDSKHTIFGEVIEGMAVVRAIGDVPTNKADDRPKTNVVLKKITIVRE